MFEVLFEVNPHASKWDAYLAIAKSIKPELEQIQGFQGNFRYKSLTRPEWLLSVSDWEDEKALMKWRVATRHHHAQVKGREEIFADYHLRIGEVFKDSKDSTARNGALDDERALGHVCYDETKVGVAKAMTLTNTFIDASSADFEVGDVIEAFKHSSYHGLASWDAFEDILTPGTVLVLCSWENHEAAMSANLTLTGLCVERQRYVGVTRDYGMFDRREAPQYYPDILKR